jgi:PTS system mannose-specific IIA component
MSACATAISTGGPEQIDEGGEIEHEVGKSSMIGMVLVTHGRLAEEFVSALEHVVGKQKNVAAICIGPDDDMERRRQEILDQVAKVDSGEGVVLLTDMFGGTPSNLAISVLDRANVEVIAGVNLPMLIKLASIRSTQKLPAAVAAAQEAGRKYINVASQLLAGAGQ